MPCQSAEKADVSGHSSHHGERGSEAGSEGQGEGCMGGHTGEWWIIIAQLRESNASLQL